MESKKSNDKVFYLHGSDKKISDLKQLAKELRIMPSHIYDHHVNHAKNDFAVWTKYSLNEPNLAENIKGHISKIELELQILRHLLDSKEELIKRLQEGKANKKVDSHKKVIVKKETSKKVTIKKDKK